MFTNSDTKDLMQSLTNINQKIWVNLEPCQISRIKHFTKEICCFYLVIISKKPSILDIWQGPEYAYVQNYLFINLTFVQTNYRITLVNKYVFQKVHVVIHKV